MKLRDQPGLTLRVPPDVREWLEEHRRKLGERSINATIIVLLKAARKQETQACE